MTDIKDSKVQQYLNQLLNTFHTYELTPEDEKALKRSKVDFILQKLLRKKFRKQKLHPDTIKEFTNKITNRVKADKPIHFTIPFGGYKHYWNSSHPETDWAELFTLKFLTEWISPILAIHEPGVVFEFISEDLILPRMNNYPPEALEQYSKGFSSLLEVYKKSLPANLTINYFRVGDKCDKEAIVQQVEQLLPERWGKWETCTHEEKKVELKRSIRSVFWNGKDDLTDLSILEKEKKMIESRLIELAYYDVEASSEFLGNYFTEDDRIGICFSFGLSPDNTTHWITLGSTYASVVDYWIGRGILERTTSGYVPRILSKEQYQKIKEDLETVALELDALPAKNYQSIEVISSTDWKSKF